ncbi:hypothetical protein F5880DRAFT_817957 [Lentinula raphanica]|nr:hypothetical protein F5880DRAFT_817957 [Lentinula raphanica]
MNVLHVARLPLLCADQEKVWKSGGMDGMKRGLTKKLEEIFGVEGGHHGATQHISPLYPLVVKPGQTRNVTSRGALPSTSISSNASTAPLSFVSIHTLHARIFIDLKSSFLEPSAPPLPTSDELLCRRILHPDVRTIGLEFGSFRRDGPQQKQMAEKCKRYKVSMHSSEQQFVSSAMVDHRHLPRTIQQSVCHSEALTTREEDRSCETNYTLELSLSCVPYGPRPLEGLERRDVSTIWRIMEGLKEVKSQRSKTG